MASEPLPDPHDNVEPLDYREQFQGREPSKFVESPLRRRLESQFQMVRSAARWNVLSKSRPSMDLNNYDRNACMEYFQAYRDCKAAWIERRKDDRRNGRPSD
ncbi:hypothetical protein B0H15DRAFT_954867 [Mycena belliarum]|uniref:Uncharacterized protein n=1 Tax=Mycena belliarum TaxID=1033014 RepID=A0AAD6TWI6_9AGAR|nr:hypothetical protein B0H15DRAFT_954867 [Mycena belliae]